MVCSDGFRLDAMGMLPSDPLPLLFACCRCHGGEGRVRVEELELNKLIFCGQTDFSGPVVAHGAVDKTGRLRSVCLNMLTAGATKDRGRAGTQRRTPGVGGTDE